MCVDALVHVAAVYQALQEDVMTQVSLNAVKVETGSAVQGKPQRVARVDVSARQLATPVVVAAAAGSMTSSRSEGTYQRPGRTKSVSPAHHGDVAGSIENVASVAV